MIVISLARARRRFGMLARLCALLFLAGFVLPRAVDVMVRLVVPAAGKGAAAVGVAVQRLLSVIGVAP